MASARLDQRDQARIREIADELGTVRLHEPSNLVPVLTRLQELSELENVCVYSMRDRTGAWRVERWDAVARMREAQRMFCAVINDAPSFPLYYNPQEPPVGQRNRVIDAFAWIEQHSPGTWEQGPVCDKVLRPLSMHRYAQPRALLCSGRRLLGWFGGMHPTPATPRQVSLLSMLVEPMRRRLAADEALRDAAYLRSALQAALSRVGAPALVITQRGAIRDANAAARALLARNRKEMTAALRAAAAGRPAALSIQLIPINDGERLWLAILSPSTPGMRVAASIAACNTRWTLTKKQQQVLRLVVEGLSNAAIAAELQCVERTVEMHMTALFDRVGVDNRAALVARVLTSLS